MSKKKQRNTVGGDYERKEAIAEEQDKGLNDAQTERPR